MSEPRGVLLDIDGVLYVGDEPIAGAQAALEELRGAGAGVRLVTNTTSRSRRAVHEHLLELGFDATLEEVLTPAAMAVNHCHERGYETVVLMVGETLREDLASLKEPSAGESAEAVILGDLGDGFTPEALNGAFRSLMDGADLIALQHNRYWRRHDALVLDVGAYAAALEYATGVAGVTVGKPAEAFFQAALDDLGVSRAVMVGDDIEADVGGALAAGLSGVLVRTGKYRADALAASGITPSAIADSIADVPALLPTL
jgi:HAD superfamily hydrolase (TIGR01458 family)